MSKRPDRQPRQLDGSVPDHATRYEVRPVDDGWAVEDGHSRARRVLPTQAEAIAVARAALQTGGGELSIQDKSGRRTETFTIGRTAFTKFSAVEGIRPTREAAARAVEFDRQELPPEERRRVIIETYRSKR